MAETTTAELTVAQAEAAALAAEQAAADLRAAVENGDPVITPTALAEAEQKSVFARLRITAARRNEAAQADADRHARAQAVAADARALAEQDDPAELAAAARALADAAGTLARLADARQDRFRAMGDKLGRVAEELALAGIDPLQIRNLYGVRGDRDTVTVYGDPVLRVHSVRPGHILAASLAAGLTPEQLGALRDAMPSATVSGEQVANAVPALAPVLTTR
ncbi:hypothetical protein ACFW2X_02185 [Streptomyces antibioticus]|uniref:hypothetical protein n=1 Tax=Streptomyces antibioticus TaxID=1890 RepID=UPI0036CCB48E